MKKSEYLDAKRAQVLEAAQHVFDCSGYAAATMDAVAHQAGMAKGNLYNYFCSKKELFSQVFEQALTRTEDDLAALLVPCKTATEKLQRLLDDWFQKLNESKQLARLVLEFWATAAREDKGELASRYGAEYARWRQMLIDILMQGMAAGEFTHPFDPAAAASLILAVLDGLVVQTTLNIGVAVDEGFLASIKRGILGGLGVANIEWGAAPGVTAAKTDSSPLRQTDAAAEVRGVE